MDPITIGLLAALTAGGAGINALDNANKRGIQEKENARIKDANKWGMAHSFGGKTGNQMQEIGPYQGPSDLSAGFGGGVAGAKAGIGLLDALNFGENNITSGTVPIPGQVDTLSKFKNAASSGGKLSQDQIRRLMTLGV